MRHKHAAQDDPVRLNGIGGDGNDVTLLAVEEARARRKPADTSRKSP